MRSVWARAKSQTDIYTDKEFNVRDATGEQMEGVILQSHPKEQDICAGEEILAVQVLSWDSNLLPYCHSTQ